ncbi:ATP-dependent DNA ligase [Microbacterium testaceum]|uniref:DUF7882 family protein n=1 Tax=Microbacterium testaceum TaxID=2033 RepID=UPI001CD94EE9|nr:ATP-dependent DNA ligase [Microbacterium testaceum]
MDVDKHLGAHGRGDGDVGSRVSPGDDVDDRVLSQLRIVIMNKLRRSESFMLQAPHPDHGTLSLWLDPATPIVMQFFGGRQPSIDTELVEQMMHEASSPDGLTLQSTR